MNKHISKEEMEKIMLEGKLLKIQKGDVYIQIPPTDLEAIKFTKEVLEFLIARIKTHYMESYMGEPRALSTKPMEKS